MFSIDGTTDSTADEVLAWLTGGVGLVIAIGVWLVVLIAYIRIIQKAGYSGWWVLIGLVPVVNVIMFLVFAYSRWPVQRELDARRAGAGAQPWR
ncbi:DUF805 domain-containing protein [Cellulomonas triticagri]|uniref:DUF805 domain-containing protein n=1 Tax=Cellulomonas triticagri TaxID=2483352 RepID=A0A3M2IS27_9CELL|nr:DUF805 domain-containing protein [Cellulomonas triticagri]RMI04732.1 hypothetical protein EBM89_17860 [Cellulomonas triticagri]